MIPVYTSIREVYITSIARIPAFSEVARSLDASRALPDDLWKKDGGALSQIKEKHYPDVFRDHKGKLLLAGINYDKKTKKHDCRIEEIFLP